MTRIGFDLDGVLADQTALKVSRYKEIYGIAVERWQVTSNVIDSHIPDKQVRRTIGAISGTTTHSEYVDSKALEQLLILSQRMEPWLISRRGKSAEGMIAGRATIAALKLEMVFKDRIRFVRTDQEKKDVILALNCLSYIDDRVEVLKSLVGAVHYPILYDPFNLVATRHVISPKGVYVFTDFSQITTFVGGLSQ